MRSRAHSLFSIALICTSCRSASATTRGPYDAWVIVQYVHLALAEYRDYDAHPHTTEIFRIDPAIAMAFITEAAIAHGYGYQLLECTPPNGARVREGKRLWRANGERARREGRWPKWLDEPHKQECQCKICKRERDTIAKKEIADFEQRMLRETMSNYMRPVKRRAS
jgi:hypothetical protein